MQIQREHKKAEAAGTRAPVKANGLPVKPPKEMVTVRAFLLFQIFCVNTPNRAPTDRLPQCQFCKKELVKAFTAQLESHAETHKGWDKQKCWPTVFTS